MLSQHNHMFLHEVVRTQINIYTYIEYINIYTNIYSVVGQIIWLTKLFG